MATVTVCDVCREELGAGEHVVRFTAQSDAEYAFDICNTCRLGLGVNELIRLDTAITDALDNERGRRAKRIADADPTPDTLAMVKWLAERKHALIWNRACNTYRPCQAHRDERVSWYAKWPPCSSRDYDTAVAKTYAAVKAAEAETTEGGE